MEQGSYMLIERGMTVAGTDGDIGSVAEVVADAVADIFRGLILTYGLLLPKQVFVPADNIVGVADRRVQLNLTKAQAERLSPPTFTPSETQATDI